jgi:plasmid stabilization system protein ParE
MSYRYILHDLAQKDYEESLKWYIEKSAHAAQNFIKAVENALQLICEHPERWRNSYKNFHELGIKKYPFTIIYAIEADQQLIIVSAVYHHKRNPKKRFRSFRKN